MRVVLTRPEARGFELAGALRESGHEVVHVPLTRIVDGEPFPDPAVFDGVLFTSANAAVRAPKGATWPRVGAVGLKTAAALAERGIPVHVVGDGGGAELAAAWGEARGQRLLLPQAEEAHPALADALRAAGADVTKVSVYRSEPETDVDRDALGRADVICFFAPSQVRVFLALGVATEARVWAYGPTTRAAMDDFDEARFIELDEIM
jgi:uroporphyrinogen-III synthase